MEPGNSDTIIRVTKKNKIPRSTAADEDTPPTEPFSVEKEVASAAAQQSEKDLNSSSPVEDNSDSEKSS